MKRFLILLLLVFLLAGCGENPSVPTVPPTEATATPIFWAEDVGMTWDKSGALKEIPLTIPDGLHYTAATEFDGDLLLWSTDNHLKDIQFIELCLVELDNGQIIAQRDITTVDYVVPRTVGESLYICDTQGGTILKLDKSLETIQQWSISPMDGIFHISASGTVYLYDSDNRFLRYDLSTGETIPVLEGNPEVAWVNEFENTLTIKYYAPDNGIPSYCVLDLLSDSCLFASPEDFVDSVQRIGDTWLYEKYLDHYIYYLHTDGTQPLRFVAEASNLKLLPEGYLLETAMDGTTLSLYGLDGMLVSACEVFESGNGYVASDLIWNDAMDGWFFLVRSYDETPRLLFWNPEITMGGDNLALEPLPEPDAVQMELEARAEELGKKFGLTILVGDQCQTQFDEFYATRVTDFDRVATALDTLDEALSAYPDGFIRQLRCGSIRGIQIQLISDLQADGSGRTGGGYNGFTQNQWDYYLMVIDIDDSSVQTYHHEMSHIIDTYLLWDSENREGALYSEEQWAELNPAWFDGYTHDYSQEHPLINDGWFVDGYATISPTEDRARVFEYAMMPYGQWTFEGYHGLTTKLRYYCRCIRDAFDTTGWPQATLWEQYLP